MALGITVFETYCQIHYCAVQCTILFFSGIVLVAAERQCQLVLSVSQDGLAAGKRCNMLWGERSQSLYKERRGYTRKEEERIYRKRSLESFKVHTPDIECPTNTQLKKEKYLYEHKKSKIWTFDSFWVTEIYCGAGFGRARLDWSQCFSRMLFSVLESISYVMSINADSISQSIADLKITGLLYPEVNRVDRNQLDYRN